MNESLYITASGMAAVQRMLDTSTRNTMGASIPGYQKHQMVLKNFGAFLEDPGARRDLVGAEEVVLFEQGDLRESGEPFSFGLMGEGFMAVKADDGQVYYTRNGDFTVDRDGRLVTRAGYGVLDEGGAEISLDPRAGPITVDRDGAIFQAGEQIAVLKIGEFSEEARARLRVVGDTLFAAPSGQSPTQATATEVHHGVLEYSRHGGIKGMVDMLVASKNYESMQRSIRSIDQLHENMIRQVQ